MQLHHLFFANMIKRNKNFAACVQSTTEAQAGLMDSWWTYWKQWTILFVHNPQHYCDRHTMGILDQRAPVGMYYYVSRYFYFKWSSIFIPTHTMSPVSNALFQVEMICEWGTSHCHVNMSLFTFSSQYVYLARECLNWGTLYQKMKQYYAHMVRST